MPPSPRPVTDFVVDGGVAHDLRTGLVWQVADSPTQLTFAAAVQHCDTLTLGGRRWRLPSMVELATITNFGGAAPHFTTAVFNVAGNVRYWSGSAFLDGGYVASISAGNAEVNNAFGAVALARCVSSDEREPVGPRFVRRDDAGTVFDVRTGLTWRAAGRVSGAASYATAASRCASLSDAGLPDGGSEWRLAEVWEQLSLLQPTTAPPRYDTALFPNPVWWTGTRFDATNFFYVDSAGGYSAAGPGGDAEALCVRRVDEQPNFIFVVEGIFSSLIAGGVSGLDLRCSVAAQSAGLPGRYVAWLAQSDGGFTFGDALVGARGWMRPDRTLVADTPEDLIAGRFHDHPWQYQTGVSPFALTVATGFLSDGGVANCNGWTAPLSIFTVRTSGNGFNYTAGPWWYRFHDPATPFSCGSRGLETIMCVGRDRYAPRPSPFPPGGRRVFLTTGTYAPGGGRARFDRHCQDEAADAGLSGLFAAMVHVPGSPPLSAAVLDGGTWFRTDGLPLAPTASAYASQAFGVRVPINVSARGTPLLADRVWTGMGAGGPAVDFGPTHCNSWNVNSAAAVGVTGVAHNPGDAFTARTGGAVELPCDQVAHLYCFER